MQGTEDSRLSEALMQFLGAANTLVAGSSHAGGRQDGLQARTFGVIPVGAQAGLIEWVQDAKPIYSIWQAWHQRRAQRGSPSNPPGTLPKRPPPCNTCRAHLFHVGIQHSTVQALNFSILALRCGSACLLQYEMSPHTC